MGISARFIHVASRQDYKSNILIYAYISFQDRESADTYALLCSIITTIFKHMIQLHPSMNDRYIVPKAFRTLFDKNFPYREPNVSDLESVLWSLLATAKDVHIVVDGLDEAPYPRQIEVSKLLGQITRKGGGNTHVLVTSRQEIDMKSILSDIVPGLESLPISNHQVNNDIQLHLETAVTRDPYRKWPMNLHRLVVDHLTARSQGSFRWADLNLRALAQETREKDVRRALKRLPADLEETYSRILQGIEQRGKTEEARSILQWMAYANRPLTVAEVAELVAFDIRDDNSDSESENCMQFMPSDRFAEYSSILSFMGGLVEYGGNQDFQPNSRVSFAHFSVVEYLQGKNVLPGTFRLDPVKSHRFISQCCLAYLQHYDSANRGGGKSCPYPLIIYASAHLWWHSEKAHIPEKDIQVSRLGTFGSTAFQIAGFQHPGNIWQGVSNQDSLFRWKKFVFFDYDSQYPLHVAAALGEAQILQILLDAGPNHTGSYMPEDFEGTSPLHAAALREDFWKFLQMHETEPASSYGVGSSVDYKAAVRGLVKAGFDCNKGSREGWRPMHLAAFLGNLDVVGALLESVDCDVNLADDSSQTALSVAAEAGEAEENPTGSRWRKA
ncbi:hypothetical protein B0I35DRAFT_115791 [Stachybotrys elegans]|uniref:NACHT domain-containing protein n=1 Tax=Stachybotrys elegans TaxID=80388 RepID=A0A8K0SYA9_9HYPO|nr:hypothetical protein B0I35DRAFT_115791 [Stachybotrys elegans]